LDIGNEGIANITCLPQHGAMLAVIADKEILAGSANFGCRGKVGRAWGEQGERKALTSGSLV
jgi:hypothetical protein